MLLTFRRMPNKLLVCLDTATKTIIQTFLAVPKSYRPYYVLLLQLKCIKEP